MHQNLAHQGAELVFHQAHTALALRQGRQLGLPQGKGLAAGPAHDPGQPFHHRRGNGRHQLFLAGIITVQVARRNACGPGDLAHACALAVAQQLLGSGLQDARPHLIFQNLRHKNEPPFTFVQ